MKVLKKTFSSVRITMRSRFLSALKDNSNFDRRVYCRLLRKLSLWLIYRSLERMTKHSTFKWRHELINYDWTMANIYPKYWLHSACCFLSSAAAEMKLLRSTEALILLDNVITWSFRCFVPIYSRHIYMDRLLFHLNYAIYSSCTHLPPCALLGFIHIAVMIYSSCSSII